MRASQRWTRLAVALAVICALVGISAPALAESAAAPSDPVSVVITSHTAAVTEYGLVNVSATTDAAGSDYPVSVSITLNGTLVSQVRDPAASDFVAGALPCDGPARSNTCTLSTGYPAGTFVGTAALVATMTTAQGHVVSSAPAQVVVSIAP
jgi:hypothetical protein